MRPIPLVLAMFGLAGGAVLARSAPVATNLNSLARMCSFYRGLEGFQVSAIVQTRGMESRLLELTMQRPNQLALHYTHAPDGFTALCDGSKLTIADITGGAYAEYAAPRTMLELFDPKTASGAILHNYTHPFLVALCAGQPYEIFQDTFRGGITELDIEKCAGTLCHHVQAKTRGKVVDFWIMTGKQPLLMRAVARDLSKNGQVPADDPRSDPLSEDAVFYGWVINPVTSFMEFQFDSLKGLKKKEHLLF